MNEQNKQEWEKLSADMDAADEMRERVIKELREAQKASKNAIYALQRGGIDGARAKMTRAREVIDSFADIIAKHPDLRHGTYSAAVEEYCEARAFDVFLETGKLISVADFAGVCNTQEYLGGVADLVGEMIRYAVLEATKRNVESVRKCRDLANDILMAFMELNLRNGALRKKSDSIKYGVKRFEEILYELSLIPEGKKIDADDLAAAAEPEMKKNKVEDE